MSDLGRDILSYDHDIECRLKAIKYCWLRVGHRSRDIAFLASTGANPAALNCCEVEKSRPARPNLVCVVTTLLSPKVRPRGNWFTIYTISSVAYFIRSWARGF
jgi:hypothetical protein